MTETILLANASVLDGRAETALPGHHVLVEGGLIREVSDKPIATQVARTIDLAGKTLMPGLIDAHVHVVAAYADLGRNAMLPDALVAFHAQKIMHAMLMRGFTTLRDVGGGTFALKLARDTGLIVAPRLSLSGKALSQTGGHTDYRGRYDGRLDNGFLGTKLGSLGRIADGVDAVRQAAREEIKAGADFIKIMANGGISSPTDPIAAWQYSVSEIEAIVEEASMAQTYVSAHLYTDSAIKRCVMAGVRSLEHCNLITLETAKLAASKGAMACPTLVTFEKLKEEGASFGLPPESVAKIDDVRIAGMKSLELMREAGLEMAYGTDLLGEMHRHQSEEFVIRGRVLPAIEVIRSATVVAAKLLRMEGQVGCVAPGAFADLIVVDGDPLKDLALLTGQGKHMPAIMLGGEFVKFGL